MQKILRILNGFFALASPIALFFFLAGGIGLPFALGAHPTYLADLASNGIVVEATIESNDGKESVTVAFDDQNGNQRLENLNLDYYTPEVRQTLQPNSVHTIRYLPSSSSGPVLEKHLGQVHAYKKDISGLYFIFGIGWLILIIRPDILYITYFKDWGALSRRDLTAVIDNKEAAK